MLATNRKQSKEAGRLFFRQPKAGDGPTMHALVERCKPLDVNSRYCYLILCEHFSSTCIVAEMDGEVVGMLTAYVLPEQRDTLFVWQVAVDSRLRGKGVARLLFSHLLKRPNLKSITTIEATVNPSNDASRALFHALARECGCGVGESPLFEAGLFGEGGHEQENLIRVGPIYSIRKTLIGRK
jgi:L-2,4-diaminobutyric acid acetyltransferase